MKPQITIEAKSPAAFAHEIDQLPADTDAFVTATENGQPWAILEVGQMTGTRRSIFPCRPIPVYGGVRGDTRKRGEAGVHYSISEKRSKELSVVISRAARMYQ